MCCHARRSPKTHDAHRQMQRLADRLREFAAVRTKGIAGLHQFAAAATAAEYFWLHGKQLLCSEFAVYGENAQCGAVCIVSGLQFGPLSVTS